MRADLRRDLALLAVGLLIVAALASWFGLGDLIAALGRVVPGYLLLYVALGALTVLGHSLRWRLVLRTLGGDVPLHRLIGGRLAGDAVGSLVPSAKIAGDPVRVAVVYGSSRDVVTAGASVTIDRILEATTSLVAALVYVGVFGHAVLAADGSGAARVLLLTMVAVLGLVIVAIVLIGRGARPLRPLYGARARRLVPRLAAAMDRVRDMELLLARFFREHAIVCVAGLVVSLLVEAVVIVEYVVLLAAFDIHVELPTVLMAMVAHGFAHAAPTPGGLGALEASQAALFHAVSGHGGTGFVVGGIMRLHETLWVVVGLAALAAYARTMRSGRAVAVGADLE